MSLPLRALVRVRPSHNANIPRSLRRTAAVASSTFSALSTHSTIRPSRFSSSTHTITSTRCSSSSSSSPTDQPAAASEPMFNNPKLNTNNVKLTYLLEDTPWRLTPSGTGLERIYVFESPRRAAEFCASIFGWTQARYHDPEWAGCGRFVYVRWTTHKPPGLSKDDIEGALACERFESDLSGVGLDAADFAALGDGADGVVAESRVKDPAEILKAGDGGQELWPKWKTIGTEREGRTAREWSEQEMAKLWHWLRRKALVEECGSKDGNFWPAWSMVWGMACVTQTRWATLVSDDDNYAVIMKMIRERRETPDETAMKKVTEETNPRKDPSEKLEGLLKELMHGRIPFEPKLDEEREKE